jgi:hypothetical protein
MIPRMIAAGVEVLHADVLPSNQPAQELLRSLFGRGLPYTYDEGIVSYRMPLAAPDGNRGRLVAGPSPAILRV